MIPLYDDNPVRRTPVVTIGLIVVNVIVFLGQELLAWGTGNPDNAFQAIVFQAGLVPCELLHHCSPHILTQIPPPLFPPWMTVFTSMFMHGGLTHIGGNMLYLWIFGNNVEDQVGRLRYLVFYLLSGVAAAALQVVLAADSYVPMVGASGAIAGMLGAYLVCWPNARVRTLLLLGWFIRLAFVPAWLILGFWFVLQLGEMLLTRSESGVAVAAHVGGFVFGAGVALLLIRPFMPTRPPRDAWADEYR